MKESSRATDVLLIAFSAALGVVGQLALKYGMNAAGGAEGAGGVALAAAKSPAVWAGMIAYVVSSAVWLVVLSRVELSFAYPMVSVGFILVLFFSRFLFDEPVSAVRWAGTVVIALGVLLISRSS